MRPSPRCLHGIVALLAATLLAPAAGAQEFPFALPDASEWEEGAFPDTNGSGDWTEAWGWDGTIPGGDGLPSLPGSGGGAAAGVGPTADHHYVDTSALPFAPLAGLETTRLWGERGGAGFRIEVPAQWNGDLVVWVWGFTGFCLAPEDAACALRAPEPSIRRQLIERGYAWASTSGSTSGWAVSRGVFDNLMLQSEVAQVLGPPTRTYMVGVSMGGKIAALSNETGLPYDGTLSLCGEIGHDEFANVLIDWNALAATLTGHEAEVSLPPAADYMERVVPAIRSKLGSPFPASPNAAGSKLRDAILRSTGGRRPLDVEAFALSDHPIFGLNETLFSMFGGTGDFAVLLHGDAQGVVPAWPIEGNEGVVYQLDDDPALSAEELDLNARIPRFAKRDSGTPLDFPHPDGDLDRPMMVVHALGDLLVPLSIPQHYTERVRASGAEDLLVTRAMRGVTHCGFTPHEITTSFDALARWVETGVRPPGDDLLDPAEVAAPDFGCSWSGTAPGVPRQADIEVCTPH